MLYWLHKYAMGNIVVKNADYKVYDIDNLKSLNYTGEEIISMYESGIEFANLYQRQARRMGKDIVELAYNREGTKVDTYFKNNIFEKNNFIYTVENNIGYVCYNGDMYVMVGCNIETEKDMPFINDTGVVEIISLIRETYNNLKCNTMSYIGSCSKAVFKRAVVLNSLRELSDSILDW